jgi:DNA-binding response OmpR family regulator
VIFLSGVSPAIAPEEQAGPVTCGLMSTVLVYSDDAAIRERVRIAIGSRPDPGLAPITWLEAADGGAVVRRVDEGGIDVCILDGEAAPTGGMGICRQLKNEIADCPAMLLLVMRRDDRWLAKWSLADSFVMQPIDPVEITEHLVKLLRARATLEPVAPAAEPLSGSH